MNKEELELERKENIEYLDSILKEWDNSKRKMKKVLVFIIVIGIIAVYFMFSELLGYKWGYIMCIGLVMIGGLCAEELGLLSKNKWSEGKLAYHACVAMEILIEIKKGTYRQRGVHFISANIGTHYELYKEFILHYPQYKSKTLKKMSKINVERKDIYK